MAERIQITGDKAGVDLTGLSASDLLDLKTQFLKHLETLQGTEHQLRDQLETCQNGQTAARSTIHAIRDRLVELDEEVIDVSHT